MLKLCACTWLAGEVVGVGRERGRRARGRKKNQPLSLSLRSFDLETAV
jgi:hypothetical protein